MRIAWFSPWPPSPSGIAAYSAELVEPLRARGWTIDVYTERNAHDFVWTHRRSPYALTVYQMGNAACHDFMWAYLFRYPGMVVLHDAQLHQARALFLTKRWQPRREDYLAEFRASHPEAPPDVGELVAAGLGGTLYHHWPMLRLVIERARLAVVHGEWLAHALREEFPAADIRALTMGVPDPVAPAIDVRARHAVAADAMVVAAFGGITPEKRIAPLLRALSAVAERHRHLQLLLVGAAAAHYDVRADAERWGLADRVHVAGFVPEAELPAYLHTADVCACLRWPTNRETSASWLRCLAAGRTTLVNDLAHLGDVPTLDPRGWRVLDTAPSTRPPVAVSIDLLDEEHSLQLALDRLATDVALRTRLGRAARAWWDAHHRLEPMVEAYEPLLRDAARRPLPPPPPVSHLMDDGTQQLRALAKRLGVDLALADLWA